MPAPYQVLYAIQRVATRYSMAPVGSLMHTSYVTTGAIPCIIFAGDLLAEVAGTLHVAASTDGNAYPNAGTPIGSFFNFTVLGSPSAKNHGFCAYFWQNDVVLIQTYVNVPVNLLRIMPRVQLLDDISSLRWNSPNAAAAYQRLFGVNGVGFQTSEILVAQVA